MTEPAWKVLDPFDLEEIYLALSLAIAAAQSLGNVDLANCFINLANRLCLGNPDYQPLAPLAEKGGVDDAAETGEAN